MSYRLHELRVENFKRIVAATLSFPASGTMEICGRNGAGKSSAIDAIWGAMGGKDASPDQPIRNGARTASVTLDLGDFKVKREWDAKGSRLTVVDAEGSKRSRPQELLDSLLSRLAFDPMEFARMKPAAQAETMRRIAGLDFTALDQRGAEVYAERTEVNRAVKQQEAALASMLDWPEAEEISVVELRRELNEVRAHNRQRSEKMSDHTAVRADIERIDARIAEKQEQIERLEKEIAGLCRQSETLAARRDAIEAEIPEALPEEPIFDRIEKADENNRRVRQHREYVAAQEALRQNRETSENLTLELDRINAEKSGMLAAAKFPVDGLALEADGELVTFGGIPFEQVSTSEQIRVSLAVAASLNPQLRLIVVKDGSLLDTPSLALVAEWADRHDYQVIVERVADSTVGVGVVIEQGTVKAESDERFALA